MRIIDILNPAEIKEFENPPIFSYQQRKVFFEIPVGLKSKLNEFVSPVNDVGLVTQMGYFRACGRFFRLNTFRENDLLYVCRILKIKRETIDLTSYASTSLARHREMILREFGIHHFAGLYREFTLEEANHLATKQFSPASIFRSLCDYLRSQGVEVPSYNTLAVIITQTLQSFEKILLERIITYSTSGQIAALDSLFDKLPDEVLGRNTYKISRYKTMVELMKLSAIRENMIKLKELKELYHLLIDLINSLKLSDELIEYYANYVISSHVFQVQQRNQKYLFLLCFIKHQYLYLNDVMIQTFMSTTQQTLRQADNRKNELLLEWQAEIQISQAEIFLGILAEAPLIKLLQDTAFSLEKTAEEKFKIIMEIIKNPQHNEFLKLVPAVEKLYKESTKAQENKLLYQAMTEKSRAFQIRIAEMLRHVEFTATEPDDKVLLALKFYQKKQGILNLNAPIEFLNREERKQIKEGSNSFNEPLYKVLLAKYVHKSIKSGKINVGVSHQFKAFEDYMIPQDEWNKNKESLMERAGIMYLKDWENIRKNLEEKLSSQFKQTFDAINKGLNPFVKKRKNNTLQFITPKKQATIASTVDLYPSDLYVPIFKLLHTVNLHTEFTKKLTHKMEEHRRDIMPNRINFATIISWGCNLGIGLMAKKTKNITLAALEKTSNWHITSKNLLEANEAIVDLMDSMPINAVFKEDENLLRSASDGQKFMMALNSIHANYSSKYFGKEKGIIIYSFLSEHYPLTYTTTFSAGDFEAWFIIDGLLHYQPVLIQTPKKKEKPMKEGEIQKNEEDDMETNRLHSTDQHGISFINSALCYLMKIEFQPRFKQIHKVKLYGMAGMPITQQTNYQINAGNNVNIKIIEEQWDNILRLVTTLKLKHITPSVLLKRLTSYSNKHPLNIALQELGKLVQTIFVLKYMHLEDLRRIINHQLTQIESLHQLSDELNLGHDGLIRFATKEELLVMARSKQLLINSIVCYNYLYQTQKIIEASTEERKEIQRALSNSAAFAYSHVNFQGEYDFSDEVLVDILEIDMKKAMNLEL
ncbi:MAG: Tn3 family transposase [Arcicella sp.]|nr:Tn3 family transposase [Arcicella sp.]